MTHDSTLGSSKRKSEVECSAMVKSKRKKIFNSFFHQNFSLPSDSIIYYIAKNPKASILYKKMIQTCKYFFFKNPILVISDLIYFGDDKWRISSSENRSDFSKITSKLWIDDRLVVQPEFHINKKVVSQNIILPVLPKLYKCDANYVSINYQIISLHDLSLLISSAENISLVSLIVKDKNDSNVPFEKIVEAAVKAKQITMMSFSSRLNITTDTMKELLKIPHFSRLDRLILDGIPETFDLKTFYAYMKKNKNTKSQLIFRDTLSEAYKNRLKEIVNEILATKTRAYIAPWFDFAGIEWNNYCMLQRIFYS